jgi:HSP20 family protein
MPRKQHEYLEKKKMDVTTHKAEPQLIAHTDKWYTPAADLFEYENEIIIEVDMPGVSKEGVEMTLQGDELIVSGHVVHDEERDDVILYREYDEGHFHLHVLLNEAINKDKISPEMTNGVLKITMPKKETYKPRKIEVKKG